MEPTVTNYSEPSQPIRVRHKGARIMVVDNDAANLGFLESLLKSAGYSQIYTQDDPRQALISVAIIRPDLILLDVFMSPMSGIELLEKLPRSQDGHLPVLMLTSSTDDALKRQALRAGADDYLVKPFDRVEMLLKVDTMLHSRLLQQALFEQNRQLEQRVSERTHELAQALSLVTQSREEALSMVGLTLEYRDYETKGHTDRVTQLALALGRILSLNDHDLTHLRWGAYLHDIGKITIPDKLLLKPGPLSAAERDVVKGHVTSGAEMLRPIRFLPAPVVEIVRHHHERWDGSGYPDNLAGDDIPLLARVFTVVDVYDALLSKRPYKPAWTTAEAEQVLITNKGRMFDEEIVDAFLSMQPELLYPRILAMSNLSFS